MATEKRLIPLSKRIVYAGDVFNSLMAEKGWSATEASDFMKVFRVVDAVEVVHGHWEKAHDDLGIDRGWKCSCCKGSVYEMTYEPYQHCPHCGAKMDGDGND